VCFILLILKQVNLIVLLYIILKNKFEFFVNVYLYKTFWFICYDIYHIHGSVNITNTENIEY
jgi:hypothetical protein